MRRGEAGFQPFCFQGAITWGVALGWFEAGPLALHQGR
jgi:hypothetical protein